MRHVFAMLALLLALPLWPIAPASGVNVVTVGTLGNEPQVVVAPDGTIYVGALQNVYASTDGGATFHLANSLLDHLSRASDSSLSVDPSGRVYYAADWPYAGITETCASDDRAASWQCNHVVVPGGTDRMWVHAPDGTHAYLVTNEGLYETLVFTSDDRGASWAPASETSDLLSPTTGPLLTPPGHPEGPLLQPVDSWPFGLDIVAYRGILGPSEQRHTGLPVTHGIPSAAFSPDGMLYVASEPPAGAGTSLLLARSADEGRTWTNLSVPTPGLGTVTFSWVAAGAPGHVGVVFYGSPHAGDPTTFPATASWSAWWAESRDAESASPTWTVTLLEPDVHAGLMCSSISCTDATGNTHPRFSGDFISAAFDAADNAHAVWMKDGATPEIHYARP